MSTCPTCGTKIPANAPESICPNCLLDSTFELSETPTDSQQGIGSIKNFTLVEEIARGGMGVIYKAFQEDLKRTVAIKMIRSGRFADQEEVERFQAEAKAAAKLRHPRIVAIHQVGEENGNHFFSMDFVQGGNLEESLGGQPLKDTEAAELLQQIVDAVAYAHDNGIIHRDLKPQNILLDGERSPHITDFGIAKQLDNDSQLTVTGVVMGSPSYMSPEQATGQNAAIDQVSDIYSLGAILYYMLTGRPPFQAATPMETLTQVVKRDPLPPISLNPSVSIDINTICLKCLSKSPAGRYQSAEELKDDLDRFIKGTPIHARPISQTEKALKWAKRNPLASALVGVIIGVAAIGFLSVWWQLQQTRSALTTAKEAQRAERSAHAPHHAPILRFQVNAKALSADFSPDGTSIVTADGSGFWRRFDMKSGALLQEQQGHNGMVASAKFSRDGNQFLTYSFDPQTHFPHLDPNGEPVNQYTSHSYGDQSAKLWDTASSAPLLTITNGTQVAAAVLSDDGNWIATANWKGLISIYNSTNGSLIATQSVFSGAVNTLEFSPDSKHLLVSSEGTAYQMVLTPNGGGGSSSTMNESFIAHMLKVPSGTIELSIPNQARSGLNFLFRLGSTGSSRSTARFSPDGSRIVTTGKRAQNNCLWNANTGELIASLEGHSHSVYRADFSPNGKLIATAGADNTAILWNADNGRQISSLKGHTGPILWVEFSPDSRLLATASGDGSARIWNVEDGICVSVLIGHAKRVYLATFSPDGLRVATASLDETVCVWDAASMNYLSKIYKHDESVLGMEFSENSSSFVTRVRNGNTRLWQVEDNTPILPFPGLPKIEDEDMRQRFVDESLFARLSPNGSKLISLTKEQLARVDVRPTLGFGGFQYEEPYTPLRVWDVESQEVLHAFPGVDKGVASSDLSPDGRFVAAGQHMRLRTKKVRRTLMGSGSSGTSEKADDPTTAWIWNTESGALLHSLEEHVGTVQMVRFTPDSKQFITADGRSTRLWNLESGQLQTTFENASYVADCKFLPGGKEVILQSAGTCGVWNLETGSRRQKFSVKGRETDIRKFTISPNGQTIACITAMGTAHINEISTGLDTDELIGHRAKITDIEFHPDGLYLATASEDKTIIIWNAQTGDLVKTIDGHRDTVTDLAFSPDGRWLGSTSRDYTARLWPVNAF